MLLVLLSSPSLPGQTSLTLGWDEIGAPGVTGYRVYYGPASRQYTNSVQVGLQFSCTITGLVDNTTNYFAVTAVDSTGNESSYSPEIRYPPEVQVQARIYPDGAALTWAESLSANVIGYKVYYGTTSGHYTNSIQTALGFVNTEPGFVCTLADLDQGTTYYFAVTSYDIAGVESDFSQEQIWTTMVFAPTAQVVARLMPENDALYWYVSPGNNVIGYNIHYGTSSGNYANSVQTGPGLVATITGLVEGMTYYFAVAPYDNANQEGGFSEELQYTVPVLALAVYGTVLPDGMNAFEITGQAGKTYQVLGSPDEQVWTPLGTGTIGLDGTLEILEPPGTLDLYPYYMLSEVSPTSINPILKLGLTAEANVLLSANGQSGHAYAVLATGSLATPTWTSLGTIYPDGAGDVIFTDTAASRLPARFYRLQDVTFATPLPPTLQIAQAAGGAMSLTGQGQASLAYNILATQDFVVWSPIATVTSDTTGAFAFTDFGAFAFPARFYRVEQAPN
jgi:hypothetical protein